MLSLLLTLLLQEAAAAAEHAQSLMTQVMKGKKLPWGKARFELQQIQQQHQQQSEQQQHQQQGEEQQHALQHHHVQQQQQQLQPHPPSESRLSSLVAPRQVTPLLFFNSISLIFQLSPLLACCRRVVARQLLTRQ